METSWNVFGGETVLVDAEPVALSLRSRMVLIRLLCDPNRAVSLDRLALFIWGDEPPKTQRNSVARFVADLRRALGAAGERIVTVDGGYRIVVNEGELDSECVRLVLTTNRELAKRDLVAAHDAVVEAWERVGFEPNAWLDTSPEGGSIAARHEHDRLALLDNLAEVKLGLHRHAELVGLLERATQSHPYHEKLWINLAAALHQSGRSGDALRTHQRLRAKLAEIGLEPSSGAEAAEQRVLSGSGTGLGPSRGRSVVAGSMGVVSEGLVAPARRSVDLRAVSAALSTSRLVTIVGIAGSGKSELAEAACAEEELEGSAVYRVDLRSIRDASRVIPAVAAAVGVPASQVVEDPTELAERLRSLSCLILLDNCDHLLAPVAAVVSTIFERALGVRVLSTSRQRLHIEHEQVFRINLFQTALSDGLGGLSDAAEFFLESMTRTPDGSGSAVDLGSVESVCASLCGHPLALGLASRLIERMPEAELARKLRDGPSLSPVSAVSTILDVIWGELELDERTTMARLSVFASGWTSEAAQFVAGEVEVSHHLQTLVDQGLVRLRSGGRFEFDEVTRRYAADRLADRFEREATLDRLVDWLRSLTERWGTAELGAVAEASEILLPEQANITEALVHLNAQGKREELAWLATRSCGLWINHGMYTEIVRWLGPVVDDGSISRPARSAAATMLLEADLTIGKFETMERWGTLAIELSDGEPHDWIPGISGFMALWSLLFGMKVTPEEYLDTAEAHADRSHSRSVNLAMVLLRRAQIAHHRREYDAAVDLFRQAKDLVLEPGRQLLAIEMGETMSLYLGRNKTEALESTRAWKSAVDTDEWHYQVDIVGAIIVGGAGEPEAATAKLAAALRRHKPVSVWGRAEEFQLAFGLLADMRGERALSDRLLSNLTTGSPFLRSMAIEHKLEARGLSQEHYHEMNRELSSPSTVGLASPGRSHTADELYGWWVSGTEVSGTAVSGTAVSATQTSEVRQD